MHLCLLGIPPAAALRRLRCKRKAATVLEAEGVLIDAVGAIIAAVGLEIALSPSGETFALGVLQVVERIGVGAVFGAIGGLAIAGLLRVHHLVPGRGVRAGRQSG